MNAAHAARSEGLCSFSAEHCGGYCAPRGGTSFVASRSGKKEAPGPLDAK